MVSIEHTLYFLSEDGTERAYYDFTGYLQAEDYINKNKTYEGRENRKLISGALELLARVLDCIKGMEHFLLFPERFSIHLDAIFIQMNTGQVVIAFFPNEKPGLTLQSRVLQLIEAMNDLYCDVEMEQYLRKFTELINNKNPGLDGMISMLGTIQREVSYIYWNAGDLRKSEGGEAPIVTDTAMKQNTKYVRWKPFMIQGIFAAVLSTVFLTDRMELSSFAGLTILAAGLDLWIMKRFFSKKLGASF